jgi:hypothetical protein
MKKVIVLTKVAAALAAGLLLAGLVFLVQPVSTQARPHDVSPDPVAPLSATAAYTTWLPLVRRAHSDVYGYWAVQMYDNLDASQGFDYAVAAGVRWMRLRVSWFNIEPFNTVPAYYQWTALDQSIINATDAAINLIVTLEGNPAWAAASPHGPVNNLAEYQQFVGALVARYPSVRYWEIYNEPDNILNFGKASPSDTKGGALYAAHLTAAYSAVKAANPQAQVVMGGLAMDWFEGGQFDANFLDDILTACTGACFDIGNFHYYPVYRANWETHGRDVIGKAAAFRQKLAAKGYTRPIMCTETSWIYLEDPDDSNWGGAAVQARYVPKSMVRGLAANLITLNWYAMIDADPDLPGLLGGPPWQLRPAYTALVRLNQQLRAARFERALNPVELASTNLEGYVFTDNPGTASAQRIDVVWYDCPGLVVGIGVLPTDCENSAGYAVPASRITVYDHLDGSPSVFTDAGDGKTDGTVTLSVNRNPMYIHYTP